MSEEFFTVDEIENIQQAKKKLKDLINIFNIFSYHNDFGDASVQPISNIENNFVIAGGVISSLLLNEKVNDIDVFILHKNVPNFNLLMYKKPGLWSVRYKDKSSYCHPKIIATASHKESTVQYILTEFDSRVALLDHFDYCHCLGSYVGGNVDKLYIAPETYRTIMKKHLIPNENKVPHASRINKFVSRGWKTEAQIIFEETGSGAESELLKNLRKSNPLTTRQDHFGDDLPVKKIMIPSSVFRDEDFDN